MKKKRVLFLVNHEVVIYNFRLEIVERLLQDGHEVHISCPYGEKIEELIALGAKYHEIVINRHGMNPLAEIGLLSDYKKLMREVKPDIVFGFTIKPNIYGAIAARNAGIPFVANITGLGTQFEKEGKKKKILTEMYRFAFSDVQRVFFQNTENQKLFIDNKIALGKHKLIPGSGVNLERFAFTEYPSESDRQIYTVIGRIMYDKGTDDFLEAARIVKKQYPDVHFRMIGFFDGDYKEKIDSAVKQGTIEYIEQQADICPFVKESLAIIQPSHHEGMSNVLLEASSSGRPVIATDIPGCRETFEKNVSGIAFKPKNPQSLAKAIIEFIKLPHEKKAAMGSAARRKMEKEFSRQIIVEQYLKELKG